MIPLLKLFTVGDNEENGGFRAGPAIVMSLLILTFVAAIIYILISSLR